MYCFFRYTNKLNNAFYLNLYLLELVYLNILSMIIFNPLKAK